MTKEIKKNNFGFTLIEILTSAFIIAIIGSLVIASYSGGQRTYKVARCVQQFAADARRMQTLALSGNLEGLPATGFGLYVVSATQYVLFYNTNASTEYIAGSSVITETVNLPADVSFYTAAEDPADPDVSISIFFLPPIPTTYVNDCPGLCAHDFRFKSGPFVRSVKVEQTVLVDIN